MPGIQMSSNLVTALVAPPIQLHRRGLPGPVGAQQREELPAAHREGHPPDRIKTPATRAAVAPPQIPDRDNAVVVHASQHPAGPARPPVPAITSPGDIPPSRPDKPHSPPGRRTKPPFPAGPRITTAQTPAPLAAASSASTRSSRNGVISGYGRAGGTIAGRSDRDHRDLRPRDRDGSPAARPADPVNGIVTSKTAASSQGPLRRRRRWTPAPGSTWHFG